MLIYRVEHKDSNIGPYMAEGRYKYQEMIYEHNDSPINYPSVNRDVFDGPDEFENTYKFICGFSSVEDLIDWFDEYIFGLQERGFVIRVFKVPIRSIRFGKK